MELEARLKEVGEGGSMARPGGVSAGDSRGIPKAPTRSSLSGHRGTITCVATHPIYR